MHRFSRMHRLDWASRPVCSSKAWTLDAAFHIEHFSKQRIGNFFFFVVVEEE